MPLNSDAGQGLQEAPWLVSEAPGFDTASFSPVFRTVLNVSSSVSVRRTHLPNSSIKGDGVRVFLSGRDHPYRQDFYAPTKLLPQAVQGPSRSGMSATWRNRVQRCHQPRHQRQRHPQMDAALSTSARSDFTAGIGPAKSRT